ncbi:MAG: hypothetical protein ACRELY_27290, partial [Polyangiaceae bacterium]
MWLGALLLPRIVTLSVGCGPQDGDEGGNCIKSNSCNQGNYCNGNLVCGANNTCVQPGPAPTYPPTVDPCDALLARSPCAAGEEARCRYERTPDPAWNGACAARLRDDAGDTVFCCDTSLPQCSAEYGESTLDPGSSGQSGSEPFSDCPGGPFMCRNLSAPPIDASIECSESPPDDAGWTSLCCVHGDACFELTPQGYPTGPTYYPQG